MTPPQPDPNHSPRVQQFRRWIGEHCSAGYSGSKLDRESKFVPYTALTEYFDDRRKLRWLIEALFPHSDDPLEADTVVDEGYLRVFATLVTIDRGAYIEEFVRHETLRDDKFPLESRPHDWPRTSERNDFWEDFKAAQWKFFPYTFGRNLSDKRISPKMILPIIESEHLKDGGSSSIYKIKIHAEYDHLEVAHDPCQMNVESDHVYVLKIYSDFEGDHNYNSEVNTFRKLSQLGSPESGTITFYGGFVQGETYNVLLQYANGGTLEDYFDNLEPPRERAEIHQFWSALFGLFTAVYRIHNMNFRDGEGRKGWHQDIKPSNILVVNRSCESPYDCQFLLADMGLSHYVRSRKLAGGEPMSPDVGGTREYGAPECHRSGHFLQDDPPLVRQSVDIWSLGCVLSEAAVWMCSLKRGLKKYRDQRRGFTDQIPHIKDPGCFHDGDKVSPVVHEAHQRARDALPRMDSITGSVLTLVTEEMLEQPEMRSPALRLWNKSQNILRASHGDAPPFRLERQSTTWNEVRTPRTRTGFERVSRLSQSPPTPPSQFSSSTRGNGLRRTTSIPVARRPRFGHPNLEDKVEDDQDGEYEGRDDGEDYDDDHDDDHDWTTGPDTISPPHRPPRGVPMNTLPSRPLDYGEPSFDPREHYLGIAPGLRKTTANLEQIGAVKEDFVHSSHQDRRQKALTLTKDPPEGQKGQSVKKAAFTVPQPPQETPDQQAMNAETPSSTPKPKPPAPTLSVPTAQQWVVGRNRNAFLPYRENIHFLQQRDHVFLVDDSESMRPHWEDVKNLFKILSWMVKTSDEDGLDLYYSMSSDKVHSKHTRLLLKHLEGRTPQGQSDITIPLGRILYKYLQDLQDDSVPRTRFDRIRHIRPAPFRPMTLYVFTDAVWQWACDGKGPIVDTIQKLDDLNIPNDKKQVGVQFISFGNDRECLKKLKYLDDELKKEYKRDIVDTEPSNGNVWKMFLGPINTWFDES